MINFVEIKPKIKKPNKCWACGSKWIDRRKTTKTYKCNMCGMVL